MMSMRSYETKPRDLVCQVFIRTRPAWTRVAKVRGYTPAQPAKPLTAQRLR
jgi:hypothetical protein